ncbi:putative flagellin [Desulfamplus magnetovallimortis]|uniref:Flagellin n=1 Tax=Desulfamplus magnetovallimortis TaxID=1246637 RepID=A0A1W1HBB1_9BACT|nr:flagellin [Desulfamplus magnetovallimortis]SLM29791.1 putative flagellin [Desulfamplus magnetovallimortis]
MSLSVKTNTASLFTRQKLSKTNNRVTDSLGKLSSGLRINKAADDASGMSIADSLRSQKMGLGQAARNASDGISIIQTADGALKESVDILNTIKVKTIQASSDGQTAETRKMIQRDIDRLLEEFDAIAKNTSFNGQKLLSGMFTNKQFQVGAGTGETVNISINSTESSKTGHTQVYSFTPQETGVINMTATNKQNGEELTTKDIDLQYNNKPENGIGAFADEINLLTELTDIKAFAVVESQSHILAGQTGENFTINGIKIGDLPVSENDADGALVKAINNRTLDTGVIASSNSEGKLELVSTDGRAIKVEGLTPPEILEQKNLTTFGELKVISKGFNAFDIVQAQKNKEAPPVDTKGNFTLISKGLNGIAGKGDSTVSQISANGEYIIFESSADNIVEGDINNSTDQFLYHIPTGEISLVSYSSDGFSINTGDSGQGAIDDSGRYVAFWSKPNNGTTTYGHVYLRDMETGTLSLISKKKGGGSTPATHGAADLDISGDGRYVVFASLSDDIIDGDDNTLPGQTDVIMYDTLLNKMTLISANNGDSNPVDGGWIQGPNKNPSVNSDGKYVVFQANNPGAVTDPDTNGAYDIVLRNTQTNTNTLISKAITGNAGNFESINPSISGDGKYVVFESDASDLVADDTNGKSDIFLHNTQTGETKLISRALDGTVGNAESFNSSISSNGRYVAFGSFANDLTLNDNNGVADAFLYDTVTEEIKRISELPDGTGGDGYSAISYSDTPSVSISDDGRYAVFDSHSTNFISNPKVGGFRQIYMLDLTGPEDNYKNTIDVSLEPDEHKQYRLCDIDVTSFEESQISIEVTDTSLQDIDKIRSNLGSAQNQLQSTIANISKTVVQVSSSESAIRDLDFADESKNYTKLNILQQSGTYAMSQANASKENLLSLLQ